MAEKKQQETKEIKIEIQLDEETAQGVYSNLLVTNHSDSEFILDFVFLQPQAPRAKVRSRVVTSPRHAKRMLASLHENVRKFEEQFGQIDLGPVPDAKTVGKYH
ncbi:MAG: DUF3467 domain-containing protein [Desulfuromonas sp.]|nr:MAG: DUF3467 domain-containing protein [Desulfuromonas sp.]